MTKKIAPILLVLLLAFLLRTYALTTLPPGLTHDEANHGREALDILDGVLLFYFPLNYGSEPVYSYTVAAAMWLFGESLLSLRLVNVVFGVAVIGFTYLWVARTFDRRMGLLTAVLLTISFWPLAGSRQALRAGMLPFFMMGAVWFFWQLVEKQQETAAHKIRWGLVVAFGVCVALTFHIYLAARVAWLLFPLFIIYLATVHRERFRRSWLPVLLGLGVAGLLVIPMFTYLQQNPEAQTRLTMLAGSLQQLAAGNFKPVWENAAAAVLAFIWPGYGDSFLAYNIPGRPVFDWLTAVFFVLGLLVALWRWKRPSYALVLLWFVVGIVPSLITGPTANTTRNLAALPAVYILPVIGFVTLIDGVRQRVTLSETWVWGIVAGWLLFAGGVTVNDYFGRWGTAVEVRDAYRHTLVEEVAYLQEKQASGPVILSSVYPGPAHDPSINLVMFGGEPPKNRWVDARTAMILPFQGRATAVIPASTPLHPAFAPYLTPIDTVMLRADDLNPGFTYYRVDAAPVSSWLNGEPVADFDGAVLLQHAAWLAADYAPGETAELLTVWQVTDPTRIGPIVPPIFTTDVVLFTHVLAADGSILAQRDVLDAPSWSWQTGDTILQIHPITIPVETAAGQYQTLVGLYDRASGERRPVVDVAGVVIDSAAAVSSLTVK